MKLPRSRIRAGLALLFLAAISLPIPAEGHEPVRLESSIWLERQTDFHLKQTDDFYSLGWSPKNHYAYLLVRKTLVGDRVGELVVQDMVADEIAVRDRVPFQDGEDFPRFWTRVGERWRTFLLLFGIRREDFQLGQFPVILDEEYYTLSLQTDRRAIPDPVITGYTLFLHSTGRGSKVVSNQDHQLLRAVRAAGFIPSPFENRVAILLLTQPLGWGGSLGVGRWQVVGASLKAGGFASEGAAPRRSGS